MTDKFTPGPWKVFNGLDGAHPGIEAEGLSIVVYGAKGDDCGVHGKDIAEIEANATLIAAAPELLQALEAMLNADRAYEYGGYTESELAAIEQARAAIAKARGL